MSEQFPLPTSARETIIEAGDGQTAFGPFDWILFAEADVKVYVAAADGAPFAQQIGGWVVLATSDLPGFFQIVFNDGRSAGEVVRITGSRIHNRETNITQGGAVRAAPLEAELDTQTVVLQEIRRDVSRNVNLVEDVSELVVLAEEAAEGLEMAQVAAETAQAGAETAETGSVEALNAVLTAQAGAEVAEANAETAETNAATSEGVAASHATAASGSATAAATAQTGAETARAGAEQAETDAETAQASAETAETNAEAAEANAAGSATGAFGFATAATTAQTLAEAARDAAAGYAAGLNLPDITGGDAGRYLAVNGGATGYEHKAAPGDVIGPAGGVANGEIPLFDTTTGKLLKGSGLTLASLEARLDGRIGIPFLIRAATPPDGAFAEDGSVIAVATYPEFVAVSYCGDGENATADYHYRCTNPANPGGSRAIAGAYFVLCDSRGEGIRGWDNGRGVDPGRSLWRMQLDAAPEIAGTFGGGGRGLLSGATGCFELDGSTTPAVAPGVAGSWRTGAAFSAKLSSPAYGRNGATEVRGRGSAALACIWYENRSAP